MTNSYQTESAPRLFINGEPATDDTAPNRKYYKPSAEESEIQRLYSATDDKGNLRFTVDPDYRKAVYEYFERKYPDAAKSYVEIID